MCNALTPMTNDDVTSIPGPPYKHIIPVIESENCFSTKSGISNLRRVVDENAVDVIIDEDENTIRPSEHIDSQEEVISP